MSGEPALIEMQLHFCADTYIDEILWRTCPKRVAPRGGVRQSLVSRRRRRRRRKGWLILMTATATRWCRAMSIAATSQQPTIARRGCYCGNTTLRCRPFQGLLSGKCQASAAVAEGLIFGVIVGCHCVVCSCAAFVVIGLGSWMGFLDMCAHYVAHRFVRVVLLHNCGGGELNSTSRRRDLHVSNRVTNLGRSQETLIIHLGKK